MMSSHSEGIEVIEQKVGSKSCLDVLLLFCCHTSEFQAGFKKQDGKFGGLPLPVPVTRTQ